MAFPHPTPDVPGSWPDLRDEVLRTHLVDESSLMLTRILNGVDDPNGSSANVPAGHVCATTWVLSPEADHVLLVHHRLFTWSAPGGHLERDESSRVGGLRELEEETGLTAFDVRPVLTGPALVHTLDLDDARPHRHWNIGWLYTASMDCPLWSGDGARWWPVKDLPCGPPDLGDIVRRLQPLVRSNRPPAPLT